MTEFNGKQMFTRQETQEIAEALARQLVDEQLRLRNDTPGRVLWTVLLLHHGGELYISREQFEQFPAAHHVLELIPQGGGNVLARALAVDNPAELPSENLFTGDVG